MKKTRAITISLALTLALLGLLCLWDRELKFLILWAFHLIPTALVAVPLWYFARHRVSWGVFDFLIITVPFLLYLAAALVLPCPKSFANLLVEPFLLACCLPLSPLTRVLAGERTGSTKLSAWLLALLCMLAIALYAFVPALSE
jgi:hypothetical protein